MFAEIQVWTIVGVASVIWLALSIVGVTSGGSVGAVVGLSDIIPLLLLGMSFFERWGWRWQKLHPHIVPVPMVRGTWRGELVSLWVDPDDQEDATAQDRLSRHRADDDDHSDAAPD